MQAFERLIIIQRQHHFKFIGIMKPKQKKKKLERYRRRIGMLGDFHVIWGEEEKFGGLPVSLNEMWPNLEITHLSKTGSNHSPMLLKSNPDATPIKKAFKFMNFWSRHPTFKDVVGQNWNVDFVGNPFFVFNHKLKKLKKALSPTYHNRERLQKVQAELIRFLVLEKEFWKQKAGMSWFQDGDRNTKFFHAQVNGRRRRLQLKRVHNSNGDWLEDSVEMDDEAVRFFQAQFHEETVPTSFGILDHIHKMIDNAQNLELIKHPTKEEALFSGHEFPRYVIHTNLVLLPKKKEVVTFSDMRPISLSWSIVKNILLTQEIITYIRLRSKAGPNVVIKLDMTKAYDRLSWLFLTKILRKMGFGERFIGLIFGIVSNNWYSVLLNGQLHGFFKSIRGVKQSDPLSPTLFVLAVDYQEG
ncbi:uncharacterized protein LOC142173621 [Nicotiana tabacum]|uniref:Uncharacterized protein LOC142173621 n=1 Tax=Nicotiana tabacum TaxID=4097 RepID=A0AC58TDR4_TOBAC